MTSAYEQRRLGPVAFGSGAVLCPENNCTGHNVYNNAWVNSIHWWGWNIATDEGEVDYWKSEVNTFVVEFLIFHRCRYMIS